MELNHLLADYGYLAVFVGSLLEGESILILAGMAAQRGHLALPLVVAIAFCGGVLGDQLLFWLGRTCGISLLRRIPGAQGRADRVSALLRKHDAALIVGIRFMYGLRLIGPVAIGSSGVAPGRFLRFNLLGAAIWAPLIAGFGYLFGGALGALTVAIAHFEELGLVILTLLVILFFFFRHRRLRASREALQRAESETAG